MLEYDISHANPDDTRIRVQVIDSTYVLPNQINKNDILAPLLSPCGMTDDCICYRTRQIDGEILFFIEAISGCTISFGSGASGGGGDIPDNTNNPDPNNNNTNPITIPDVESSGGGGTDNDCIFKDSDGNCIGIISLPINAESASEILTKSIGKTIVLTKAQYTFLSVRNNLYITETVAAFIKDNENLTESEKLALSKIISILNGTETTESLTTIEEHEMFTSITGSVIENADPIFFSGIGNIYDKVNVNSNLNLADRSRISLRTVENFGIIKSIKEANPTLIRITEFLFDYNQGERFTRNHHFVTTLSDIKKIIADNAPRTQEEWRAVFEIMKPLLVETAISFLPGGSIALDLNTLYTQVNRANPDYTDVTLAMAGILTEVIPWAKLSKAFVKVFDTTRRSFLIFNRTKKYLNKIVSIIRGGNRIHVDDANRIFIRADNTGSFNLDIDLVEMEADALRVIENAGKNFISPKDINRLTEVVPTNLGFISASQIRNNAVKIKLENPADAATVQLIKNGQDTQGHLSEDLFYAAMQSDGFSAIPRLDLAAPGPQGFDNVLIRRDANGNLEDVLINESKQLTNGTIELSRGIQGSNNSRCSNCVQMSEEWIDDVTLRMLQTSNQNTVNLAIELRNFGLSNIRRSASGVDRVTGHLTIVKL